MTQQKLLKAIQKISKLNLEKSRHKTSFSVDGRNSTIKYYL